MNKRVLWVIWDAASKDITELMLKENKLPNLKIIKESGISRRVKLSEYNCQTPNALAIQFTGMDTEKLKIGGYYTPIFEDGQITLKYQISFSNTTVAQNSLWLDLLKKNKKIILANIPFANNEFYFEKIGMDFSFNFNGYEYKVCDECILKSEDTIMSHCIYNNVSAKQMNIQYLNRRVQIYIYSIGSDEHCDIHIENSKSKKLSLIIGKITSINEHAFWITEYIGFRVYGIKRENAQYTILFTAAYSLEKLFINTKNDYKKLIVLTGPFFGESYGRVYRQGGFGKLKIEGGDGTAENIYLNISVQLAEYINEYNYYIFNNIHNDFMITYQPCIDEVSHEIFGHWKLAHEQKKYDNEKFYWELLTKIYSAADKYIGKIQECSDENINIIVTSDHGMARVSKEFYINEYFKQLGYLNLKEDNTIDIATSDVFYHPCNNGSLFVNSSAQKIFKTMIQPDLIGLIDVDMNLPPIYKITKMEKNSIYGDYYIECTEGYILKSNVSKDIFKDTNKSGVHISRPDISSMDAIYYAAGSLIHKDDREVLLTNKEIRRTIENVCSL